MSILKREQVCECHGQWTKDQALGAYEHAADGGPRINWYVLRNMRRTVDPGATSLSILGCGDPKQRRQAAPLACSNLFHGP